MPRIFISYRREDTAGHAGRLLDSLRASFGAGRVFMDVTSLRPGVEYAHVIDDSIQQCDFLLVVIGRDWLTCTTSTGERRLTRPDDFLRLEIASALRERKRVIPVLVEDAKLPAPADLPEDIRGLVDHQSMPLAERSWHRDVDDLVRAMGGMPNRRIIAWVGAGILGLALAIMGALFLFQIEVPSVTGHSWADAQKILESAHLSMGSLSSGLPGIAAVGTVLSQSPAAGSRAPRAAPVNLVLAAERGAEVSMVPVPALNGMPLASARAKLESSGMQLGALEYRPVTQAPFDVVIGQSPAANQPAARGSMIALVLSQGQGKPQPAITVPAVVGRPEAEGVAQLRSLGLATQSRRVEVSDASIPTGQILSLIPAAGSAVPPGTSVDVQVAARATVRDRVVVQGSTVLHPGECLDLDTGRVFSPPVGVEDIVVRGRSSSIVATTLAGRSALIGRATIAVPSNSRPAVSAGSAATMARVSSAASLTARAEMTAGPSASIVHLPSGACVADSCRDRTQAGGAVSLNAAAAGTCWCVHTNRRNYAVVTLLAPWDAASGAAQLRFTTWGRQTLDLRMINRAIRLGRTIK